MSLRSRDRVVAGVVALLALGGLAVISIRAVSAPPAVSADAPADVFSADRAFRHVQQVGVAQHPVGSRAGVEVGDYIVSALTRIGLAPQIQQAVGATDELGRFGMARVRNIVAVLPGTASTGRVVMFAHYDSVQVSFGGNDDGAGVATLLETARAMKAGAPPANDIVFLFTDGEEECICGAEAFVNQHPLAAQGGIALNFESRGSTGPAVMFETSTGNSAVVGLYGGAVPYPVATSFAVEVYRILPNDTDFTPFRESGRFAGLNSAYIDGSAVYHAPEDKPGSMDLTSLQQHGANALALARAVGGADIAALSRTDGADSTYFPVLGVLLRYPGWLVWPLAALAVGSVIALAVLARRRGLTRWRRTAAGLALALVPLLLAPAAAQLLWTLLVTIRPGYGNMMDPWSPGWFRACVLALVATILLTWYGLLRSRMGGWPLVIGAQAWLAVLGVLLAALAPGGSYLAAVPALAGALGCLVATSGWNYWLRLAALLISAGVAVVVLVPAVFLFLPALGLETGGAAALFAMLLGLALLPVIDLAFPAQPGQILADADADAEPAVDVTAQPRPRQRRWSALPGAIAGALTVACLIVGLNVDRFDTEHPAPTELAYALDTDTGQARWISGDATPSDWVSQYVTDQEDVHAAFGVFRNGVHTGPAAAADLPAPALSVVADSTTAGHRNLAVTITPQRSARLVYLEVRGTVLHASVGGRDIPAEQLGDRFPVAFYAPPAGGLPVTLELGAAGPVQIRVMDGSDGLDGLPGFTPRPAGVGILGSHTSELVVVARTYTV